MQVIHLELEKSLYQVYSRPTPNVFEVVHHSGTYLIERVNKGLWKTIAQSRYAVDMDIELIGQAIEHHIQDVSSPDFPKLFLL